LTVIVADRMVVHLDDLWSLFDHLGDSPVSLQNHK